MKNKEYSIEDFLKIQSTVGAEWSHDGKTIFFLSNKTGSMQLYSKNLSSGEVIQHTQYDDGIISYQVSPKTNDIVFSKAIGGDEQAQLFLLDSVTNITTPLTSNKKVRHVLGLWSHDGRYISFASNKRNGTDIDIGLMNMETKESVPVFTEGGNCYPMSFSPDDTYFVLSQGTSNTSNELWLYTVEDSSLKKITNSNKTAKYVGATWIDGDTFITNTDYNRDTFSLEKYYISKDEYISLFDIGKKEWNVIGHSASLRSGILRVMRNEGGYGMVNLYKIDGLEEIPQNLPQGVYGGMMFSPDGKEIAYTYGDSTHAHTVYLYNIALTTQEQLLPTIQNVPNEALVEPTLKSFDASDGIIIPYFIYYPRGYKKGDKYPVIINIHGGPEAQYRPGFDSVSQYLVHDGYIVVAPNVRGSAGYGKNYLALDDKEKRMDSVRDIVELRSHLLRTENIDGEKVMLIGGSYGGFMVYACLAFYPRLWVAGVSIVGIANFITFLEQTASYRRHIRESEYGSLQDDRELLESISPLHKAKDIRAPLMIVHGKNDPRVPLHEAEQMMKELRSLGREVELIVYADEGHGIVKQKNKLDLYPKIKLFLEKHK